jgi:DNA-binding CsgD family transcriptional regulator/PAS domain-containing protein
VGAFETNISRLAAKLDAAVVDTGRWENVCDSLADTFGGLGTILIPFTPSLRGPGAAHSASMREGYAAYLRDGWNLRDSREACVPIARSRGFSTDLDVMDSSRMRRDPYYTEFLRSFDVQHFIGIAVKFGAQDWVATVQFSVKSGPPSEEKLERVRAVRPLLTNAARQVEALGRIRMTEWQNFASELEIGVVLISRDGRMSFCNGRAESLLSSFMLHGRREIRLPSAAESSRLKHLILAAANAAPGASLPPPVNVYLGAGERLIFDVMPAPASLRTFHGDSAAMMTVRLSGVLSGDVSERLRQRYGMTNAEANVAQFIAKGASVMEIADRLGISEGTVRQQIKAALRKSGAGTQAQLVSKILTHE